MLCPYNNGRQNGDLIDPLQVASADVPASENRQPITFNENLGFRCHVKYQTHMHHMTHCVSASEARALTQMDTNTAGTPKKNKERRA